MSSPPDDRYVALGQVVEMAAVMEISLRMAFCGLLGSKYAAVVAQRQETHWLIENCEAMVRQHHGLREPEREAIRRALGACRAANRDRNRLVHDAWGTGPGGAPATIQSRRRNYEITGRSWAAAEIREVAEAIAAAQHLLLTAVEDALGPESLQIAGQLRAEDDGASGA